MFLSLLWDVFNTFLRRTTKTFIYKTICPGHTSEKFMVGCKISKSELFGSIKTLKIVFFRKALWSDSFYKQKYYCQSQISEKMLLS